jgi:hypothetical protein
MSGAICPDCGETWFERDPKGKGAEPSRCTVCGWRGDLGELGRKIMAWTGDEGPSLKQLKEIGKLFFVRVWLTDGASDDITFEVIEALEVNGAQGKNRLVFVQMDRKPTDAQIAAVRRIAGVRDVEVV